MDVDRFKQLPVLGIVRGVTREQLEPLVETVIKSGLETIEITMNTPAAGELIRAAVAISKGRLVIGAGTVLDQNDLRVALDSGATFIVMPVVVNDVIAQCRRLQIPVFPGALTPQEIYTAWQAGATMVKVFPSGFFGPEYFREIKGPFGNIELLACGGVRPENLASYFQSGASAVSFGASVFRQDHLAQKDFDSIGEAIRTYIRAYVAMRSHADKPVMTCR